MSWRFCSFCAAIIAVGMISHPAFCADLTPAAAPAVSLPDVKRAASDAAARVLAAQGHRAQAEADAGLLTQTASFPAPNDDATLRMEALTPILKNILAENLLGVAGRLTTDANGLTASATALANLRATQAGDAADLATALTEASKQKDVVAQTQVETMAAQKTLTDARDACVTAVAGLFSDWDSRLTPLTTLSGGAASLLAVLPTRLTDLADAEAARGRLGTAWSLQAKLLSGLGADAEVLGKVKVGQTKLGTDVTALATGLPAWLGLLKVDVDDLNSRIAVQQLKVLDNAQANAGEGKSLALEGQKSLDAQTPIGDAVNALVSAAVGDPDLAGPAATLGAASAALKTSVDGLWSNLNRLHEALGGDRTDWVAEPVSLFYFDDVRRLMNILNPAMHEVGDTTTLKAKSAAAQAQLNQAEADRADAQALVNTRQHRLDVMKEMLREAKAQVKTSDGAALIFSRRLTTANDQEANETTKLTNATNASALDSTNPLKTAALESARRAEGTTKRAATDASNRSVDANGDQTKAQQSLDDLKNENDSLPTAITQAEEQLGTAQQAVVLHRRLGLAAALAVTQAFADTRDNVPFLKADADAGSRDPARRVEMYAFNDSKTIFLRGPREDVGSVKALIAKIDQPVPQARLTLWTLEMDIAGGNDATRKFDQALQTVGNDISGKRTQIAAAQSLLRSAITNEVKRVSLTRDSDFTPEGYQRRLTHADIPNAYESRLKIYADDFFGPNRDLMRAAGFDLPDPAGATTLGEALLVLSMTRRNSKENILFAFNQSLEASRMFNRLDLYRKENGFETLPPRYAYKEGDDSGHLPSHCEAVNGNLEPGFPNGTWFASLRRNLGASQIVSNDAKVCLHDASPPPYEESDPCPAQRELLQALRRKALARIADKLEAQGMRLKQISLETKRLNTSSPADKDLKAQQLSSLLAERNDILDQQIVPLLNALPQSNSAKRLIDTFFAPDDNPEAILNNAVKTLALSGAVREQYATDTENARVAAADQMLKEMIIAMEDDLDRYFVSPMLRSLTAELRKQRVQVGVLNRTSVLVSNRLVARVDPRGTGQVEVGEEQNALQDAQELASLTLATQTAGLSGLAGLSGALGGLSTLPRDAPPSLYGVTNGSVFQITPVIDPSGQALRFRFDYVSSTQVQEPNGSLDPQLPRIEHHAVNTEVQLSNMELRNISQFDGNVKLGITPQKQGGIPVLKDLPILSDLPLIGWFSRRKGQAAVTQQSLIFAQTTIYPTINDLIPLLAGEFQGDGFRESSHPRR